VVTSPMEQIVCIPRVDSRGVLAALKNEPTLCAGTHVVYVYFLADDLISYPKGQSNIIYVGEAMRDLEPTGVRFRQHVTPTAISGADMGEQFRGFAIVPCGHGDWSVGLQDGGG
jgi:hypothetical protein